MTEMQEVVEVVLGQVAAEMTEAVAVVLTVVLRLKEKSGLRLKRLLYLAQKVRLSLGLKARLLLYMQKKKERRVLLVARKNHVRSRASAELHLAGLRVQVN
jgi:hypothetical protein